MSESVSGTSTLEESREWLRERLDAGAKCPCCTQRAQVYRRNISGASARVLIAMWNKERQGYVSLPEIARDLKMGGRGDDAKARYWGLIEPQPDLVRDDGSTRTGWWRLTDAGVAFIRGKLSITKYAKVFDGRCLGFTGADTNIRECLGKKFNYDELMRGGDV